MVGRRLDITLDRSAAEPLYLQLSRAIERAIATGELADGDRLENELSLTDRLGVSRPTARQAIQELVNKGLLVRKRGVGTQVIRSKFSRDERLSSLYDDLVEAGKTPTTRLLDFRVGPVPDAIAQRVSLPADEPYLQLRRLRLADDLPLAVLANYLPARIELDPADLEQHGLYPCLRRAGVTLKLAHQRVGARLADEEEAKLLGAIPPLACLTADRLAYDDSGRLVEYGRHIYHAARYSIRSSLAV
ncbi:GntR family transcriptional regulator [Microlunatus parietis]|uniref:DNA-binding GntR family transcriptional regulator n=1 Tax=Microlunatus parietis TaxID=682979 RepID=A0A7Y9I3S8_9ACTN|nr:GntR family transcriptional regulator [Microlunatus parietis]NYE69755.1 DNA-binding GntR family transcriptional regulator [Microlunatus parietis]